MTFHKKKIWLMALFIFVLIVLLLPNLRGPIIQISQKIFSRQATWYAIHLNNDQIYFGHIKSINDQTIKLTNAYYLESYETQPSQNPAGAEFQIQSAPQKNWRLVKQGAQQVFTTDQVLSINRSSVLFWEKLAPEAEAVKLLEANRGVGEKP